MTRAGANESAFRLITDYLKIDQNKKFYPALYTRGIILKNLGNYESAIVSLDESIKLNPDFYEARILQCNIFLSLNKYEKAISACDQGIEIIEKLQKGGSLKVKVFKVWHQKAETLYRMGRNKEAIEAYSIAINLLPNPHSYLNRGVAREALGDYKGAIEDYSQTIQLNPKYLPFADFLNANDIH